MINPITLIDTTDMSISNVMFPPDNKIILNKHSDYHYKA
jgi:hypothetical protein